MAAAIGVSLSAAPSHAIELFGFKFLEPDAPDTVEMIDPVPYGLKVRVNTDLDSIRSAVDGASDLIRNSDRPAPGRAGLLAMANGDYARIIDSLYGVGRFGPRVSIRIDGQEAADVPLNVKLPPRPEVVITVDPGPSYRFRQVDIVNAPPGFDRGETGFVAGEVASSTVVRGTARDLVRQWQEQSHALADIAQMDITADHGRRVLDVKLVVEAGPPVAYGPMTVSGSKVVDAGFLKFVADLPRGEPYHPDDIVDAQKRLVRLDTFRTVDVAPAETLSADGTLPIAVEVTDRKPRRFGFGASYGTLDGLGVEGFWLHRNIFGRAERLRFDGKIAGIGRSADPEDYDYEATGTYLEPGFITPETEFRLKVGARVEKLENYEILELTLSAGVHATVSDALSFDSTLSQVRSRIDDSLGRRRFSILGLDNRVTYDTRDNKLDATSGYFLEARAYPFFEGTYDGFAVQGTLEARAYMELPTERGIVLAGRAKIGTLSGIPLTQAPPQTLFFSGGGGSIRGFEYQGNGVDIGGGQITGGASLAEFSGEVRVDLPRDLSAVGFVDAGIVGAGSFPDFSGDWKVGAGLGLRWDTGLGPLRIDVARAVNKGPGDPAFALYIGLGQAF